MAKKKGGLGALLPVAIAAILLGIGGLWLVVGLIIGICFNFNPEMFNPIFWVVAGALFLVGLILMLIFKVFKKNK